MSNEISRRILRVGRLKIAKGYLNITRKHNMWTAVNGVAVDAYMHERSIDLSSIPFRSHNPLDEVNSVNLVWKILLL